MPHLQPYLVFNAEATRLNSLYWSSKYSYTRIVGVLRLIAETSQNAADPRVDALWQSHEIGQSSTTTTPLSTFVSTLEKNVDSLRTTSILHICSAFENALCGYYALCALYVPTAENAHCTSSPIPSLLGSVAAYESRKKEIFASCKHKLRGKYTKRVKVITDMWSLPPITVSGITRIDDHYTKRHLIAHDQGIFNADAPEMSSGELLLSRISIDEITWKALISDFTSVLYELDRVVAKHVATDGGLALAIFRIIERDGAQNLSALSIKLADEWRFGHVKKAKTKQIAESIGMIVKNIGANKYTIMR
jgi:hypothetical protein